MMRNNKSGHAALLRPTYSGPVVALALAVAAIAAPASFGQGKSAAPATTQTTQPATAQTSDRADAYYHYMLAHEYEEMANTYGRSEYATRAVEDDHLVFARLREIDVGESQRGIGAAR